MTENFKILNQYVPLSQFQLIIIISVYHMLQPLNMDDAKQKAML